MRAMPEPVRRRRRWLRWLVAAAALAGLLGGVAFATMRDEGDAFDPTVEFGAPEPSPVVPQPPTEPIGDERHPADDDFEWPVYGYTKARTHTLPLTRQLRPPFEKAWAVTGRTLLEFTPVLCGRSIFLLKNNGALYSISRTSGRVRWKRKLGNLAASSPACSHGTVYNVLLSREEGVEAGRVVAVDADDGRTRWSRRLPSRSESSPLLDDGSLFFGTEDGTVYRLNADDGAIQWRYKAAGEVKGALALSDGKLFFGDYGGRVHAIDRETGRRVWSVAPRGAANFYSSAAVAYGRVYLGGTDGAVYSLSARTGRLAWRKQTGDFVYASPAVTTPDGGGPSVFIGSYNGKFYALDARNGDTRWSRDVGGKISGAATVIGDLVFFSELEKTASWALGVNTGQTVWKTDRGAFNPAISDGRRIYFLGYSSIFALDADGVAFDAAGAQRRVERGEERERAADEAQRQRERAAQRAQQERSEKYRTALHGHRHSNGRKGRHCHEHRHTYDVRGEIISFTHEHCHSHTR